MPKSFLAASAAAAALALGGAASGGVNHYGGHMSAHPQHHVMRPMGSYPMRHSAMKQAPMHQFHQFHQFHQYSMRQFQERRFNRFERGRFNHDRFSGNGYGAGFGFSFGYPGYYGGDDDYGYPEYAEDQGYGYPGYGYDEGYAPDDGYGPSAEDEGYGDYGEESYGPQNQGYYASGAIYDQGSGGGWGPPNGYDEGTGGTYSVHECSCGTWTWYPAQGYRWRPDDR